jgi:hypothetical protein
MTLLSRRDAIGAALLLCSTRALMAQDTQPQPPDTYASPAAADEWVKAWADSKRSLLGALNLFRFVDPTYVLTKDIGWSPTPAQAAQYRAVTVPSGFVTDFASIPRAFWSVLRPDGDYAYAAIIHDYLYWTQPVPRETADDILRFAMQDLSVDSATVTVIYRGVRLGGGRAWDENARLKGSGEKRVLKRLPEAPTVRWADWKQMPDVFL